MQTQPEAENAGDQSDDDDFPGYWRPDDFIPAQVASFQDVFDALKNAMPQLTFYFDSLFPLTFRDDWNSTQPLGGLPVLESRSGSQVTFCVGKFKQDLPTGDKNKPQTTPSRLRGQPAFIKIFVNKPTQHPYGFSDSRGVMASPQFIDFDRDWQNKPFEIAHFLKAAMAQYDEMEVVRLRTYNVNLARYIIRRRLIYWTKHGWYDDTVVPGEDEIFARFERLALAREDRNLVRKALVAVNSGEPIPEDKFLPVQMERKFLAVPELLDYDDDDDEEE